VTYLSKTTVKSWILGQKMTKHERAKSPLFPVKNYAQDQKIILDSAPLL
jgi:hypothetical protein